MLFNRTRADTLLARESVEAVVATSRENVEYVTGHQNPTHMLMKASMIFAVYSPQAQPAASAIIPTLEVETFMASRSWVTDLHLFGFFARSAGDEDAMDEIGRAGRALMAKAHTHQNAVDGLVAALRERGLESGVIAVDESGLSPDGWKAIVAALPKARIVPASTLLWTIRVVKTPAEIDRLRTAARLTEIGVHEAIAALEPGMRDRDIARAFHASLVRNDALPSFTMFASGTATGQPHLKTSDRVVQSGDLVRWDVGCTYESYHADTARAITLGEPTARQQRIWDLLVQGVEDAIALTRPGADPADLYNAAMSPIRKAQLPDCERFHCGHGIGIAIYDPPVITATDPTASVFRIPRAEGGLEVGTVFNIEVGYYMQGEEGFLCEDTLVVTNGGFERLTTAPKALQRDRYLS
jgi:Xaa-Pro dipeptidase